jgi:SAM-dependent methyltransferase
MTQLLELLICPACGSLWNETWLSHQDGQGMKCSQCAAIYPTLGPHAFRVLATDLGKTKETAAAFWGDLYRQLYSGAESLEKKEFNRQLELLEDYFRKQHHLAATEVQLGELAGKVILEIGSGSGAHSALFRAHGATMIAVDLTPERVVSTQRMLGIVDSDAADYLCLNADAENLPLRNDSVDMVYSNGVLHHSPNTEKCLAEVHRVLKPGGVAALMLYCRSSALFFSLLLWQGLLDGSRLNQREEEWLGRITEGKPVNQEACNPITRVYDRSQLGNLLTDFEIISLRKNSFEIGHLLPRGAGRLNQALQWLYGTRKHPGGLLVYGEDANVQSGVERWLAGYLGFDWNILIKK